MRLDVRLPVRLRLEDDHRDLAARAPLVLRVAAVGAHGLRPPTVPLIGVGGYCPAGDRPVRVDVLYDGETAAVLTPAPDGRSRLHFSTQLPIEDGLRRVRVVIGQGQAAYQRVPPAPKGGPYAQRPGWFTHMDRNGDGDLSAREFLGAEADFRKLDADGDGLVSAEEARKGDKAGR